MERICKVIEDALGNEVERDIGRNIDSKEGQEMAGRRWVNDHASTEGIQYVMNLLRPDFT